MASPPVLMYSKSWCPYCQQARALLTGKGAQIEEVDIEQLPERRAEMIRRSGRSTVPQIFIGARHVGGFDDIYELDVAGGLDPLLRG